jgi:hypothetical protein
MAGWMTAWPTAAGYLQSARENAAVAASELVSRTAAARQAIVTHGAPIAGMVVERGAPLASQAREQALRVGGTVVRAAGPTTSAKVRGWLASTAVSERGLMRGRGALIGVPSEGWADVTLMMDGGVLKVFRGWEALESDPPAATLNLALLVSVTASVTAAPEGAATADPHCFTVAVRRAGDAAAERAVFQANNDEECRRWVGLLQGVADALSLRSRAGQALSSPSSVVRLPASVASSTAPTTLTAQARGFFTSATHEGVLQVPKRLVGRSQSADTAPTDSPLDPEDAEFLGEAEAVAIERADAFVDAWAQLAHGQLKLYQNEEDCDARKTPHTVIDLLGVSAVLERGPRTFELVLPTSGGPEAASGSEAAASPGPYIFKALVPEDRATWVGLLRGVEQSLGAKARLEGGRQAVAAKAGEAATLLWGMYESYTGPHR